MRSQPALLLLLLALWAAVSPLPIDIARAQTATPAAAQVELVPDGRRPVAQTGEALPTTELRLMYAGARVTLSGDPPPDTPFGADDQLVLDVTHSDGTTAHWERRFNQSCLENEPIPAEDVTSLFQPGLNMVRVTISDICGAQVGTLGPILISGVIPAPAGAAAPSGRGSSSAPVGFLLGLAVLLAAGAGILIARRRPKPAMLTAEADLATGEVIPSLPLPSAAGGKALVALQALANGKAGEFEVGTAPITIGSGGTSRIRVPEAEDVAREHARVWLRDGRLMIHHLLPGYTTLVSGKPVTWASVQPGDEIRIGPYILKYLGITDGNTG